MTKDEALQIALEALESERMYFWNSPEKIEAAITAIKEALAEQPQEPKKFDPNESFAREEAAQARVREFMRNH